MANLQIFDCTVDWEGDDLKKSVETAISEIENSLTPVLNKIGSSLITDLQKYIARDVYKPYHPTSYPRRKDHPEFGTPLDDMKNFNTKVDNQLDVATLEFDYSPDGTHKGKMKDTLDYDEKYHKDEPDYANKPLKPHPVHGDALIKRIETGEGYDWKCSPGERPFWENFVNHEMHGGIRGYFNTFMGESKLTKYDYEYKPQRSDFTYDYNDTMPITDRVFDSDEEDDLPF